jgi:hypothetical protein
MKIMNSYPARKGTVHPTSGLVVTPVRTRLLQRKCACGQHTGNGGECEACKQKRLELQRAAVNRDTPNTVPPIVHDVLRSPGQPLDPALRAWMEPRFGHTFGRVRVHTDEQAAKSARAVQAQAYAVGNDLVFNTGAYRPATRSGQALLAHELAHVVQQSGPLRTAALPYRISEPSDPSEQAADALASSVLGAAGPFPQRPSIPGGGAAQETLFRRVLTRQTNCPANTNGAPADPLAELTAMDATAGALCGALATLLAIAGALTEAGLRNPGAGVDLAYQNTFGLPPARPGGFLNRLTGAIRPSLNEALGEEMGLLALRYQLLARFFSQPIPYRCGIPDRFGGCPQTAANCAAEDAGACEGVGAIFLCPSFWGFDTQQQAGVAIHEAAHINWGSVGHGARGPGGNFRHAECYAELVAQVFAFGLPPTGNPCVAPGP